jgi:hypothetical protein
LCFITTKTFLGKEKNTLAFNRYRCCHLVLCLQLIPFHSTSNGFVLVINIHADKKVKIWSKIRSFFHRNICFFCSRTFENRWVFGFPFQDRLILKYPVKRKMFHYCPWLILSRTNKNNVVPDVQCQSQPRPLKLLDWNIVKGKFCVPFSYHLLNSIPFPSFYWSSEVLS